ncbi:hypothetical protein DYB34_001160 [Aphanomyces astaci]|uniref:Uncharacterized protein n=1 Tax=Aphanomyces astaci TaxID=112090 RepID=A0A418C0M3_APHAT|nr:hypothetical protein DYB34_001160 [Aphanomyces astaci]
MKRKHESPSPALSVMATTATSPSQQKIQLAAHHLASSNTKTRKRTPSLNSEQFSHDIPERELITSTRDSSPVDPVTMVQPAMTTRTPSLLLLEVPTKHPQSPNSIEPSPKVILSSRDALPSPRLTLPPKDQEHLPPTTTTTAFPPKRARNRNPGNLILDLSQMTPMQSPTKAADCTNVCSQVTDFLFVGGAVVASQRDVLERHGITHVINCAATITPNYFPHVFDYYRLRLRDHATQDIHQHFYNIFQFIDTARARHGKVFIHCVKGISRSPAMAIAYLMAREQLGLYPALELVRSSRPVIDPNAGFIFQLNEWDSLRQLHCKQPSTIFRVEMSQEDDVDGETSSGRFYPLIIGPVPSDHLMASSSSRDPYVSISSADESLAPDAPYPSSMHVHFRTTHGTDLEFDVRLKRDLFAADSFVWAHDGPELALLKSHKPHHIAYEGKVPHGYIRLTMFDRHMFHATIKLHDKIVVVDPVGHHKNAHHLSSPVTGMVAYSIPLASATLSNQHHRQLTSFGRMAGCTWSSRQITVGVASDAGFTSEHGAAQTQSYLIAVYNSVNGLYDDQIGVHLTIGAFLIETGVGGPAWNVEPGSCGAMADMDVHLDVIKAYVKLHHEWKS